jgi:Domain of unknown function (DUF4345)
MYTKPSWEFIWLLLFSGLWLWCLALAQKHYWKAATISNILFMLGLALGRLISFAVDGIPSSLLFLGCFGELIIAFYGYYLLKKTN